MNEFWWALIGLVCGGFAGAAVVWVYREGTGSKSVQALQEENTRLREDVTDHFVQTAKLINRLTDSYKAVFDHLSEGAENLVDPETLRERLPEVGEKEVKLRRIGAPSDSTGRRRRREEDDPPVI